MISVINENTFLITLSDKIKLSLTQHIASLVKQIKSEFGETLLDITPSYTTILVQIDLLKLSPLVAQHQLIDICDKAYATQAMSSKLIKLPVYYDISVGWDLQTVANNKDLSIDTIIHLHCEKIYQVCAIGFAPGFAFLAELDNKIKQPRHSTPRSFVPAGSVAIAEDQTAVYPANSPGGWHIIGNCPTTLFDLNASTITPFSIGDRVKFNAITHQQFIALGGKVINER